MNCGGYFWTNILNNWKSVRGGLCRSYISFTSYLMKCYIAIMVCIFTCIIAMDIKHDNSHINEQFWQHLIIVSKHKWIQHIKVSFYRLYIYSTHHEKASHYILMEHSHSSWDINLCNHYTLILVSWTHFDSCCAVMFRCIVKRRKSSLIKTI